MKLLILVLIFISFFQAALLPLNFVLLILISRSFVVNEKRNYYLAFGFGLLLSLLLGLPLGFLSLIYLLAVIFVHLVKSSQFSSHWLFLVAFSAGLLTINSLIQNILVSHSTINSVSILIESLLVLPIYIAIKFWEERFIPKSDFRLKVGK